MDGSEIVKLTSQTAGRARGITVDYKESLLYWANDDGIWMSNLEGQDAVLLTGNQLLNLRKLFLNSIICYNLIVTTVIAAKSWAVGSDKIFWIDGNEIKYCERQDLCSTYKTFVAPEKGNVSWFKPMIVAHSAGQPMSRENPCRNSSCSHICVLAGKGHTCMCPSKLDYLKISSNSKG